MKEAEGVQEVAFYVAAPMPAGLQFGRARYGICIRDKPAQR